MLVVQLFQAKSKREEKTDFEVVLKEIGPNKIKVIKEIRTITALGLKESKDLVDGAPSKVKEHVDKKEAEGIKEKLEAVGASCRNKIEDGFLIISKILFKIL